MKKVTLVCFTIILCFGLAAGLFAQEKERLSDDAEGPPQAVTLRNGACEVTIDSYGRSTNYNVGAPCGNILFETIDFISVSDNPVQVVDNSNFPIIVEPITLSDPFVASSRVSDGTVEIAFFHSLEPPPSCAWNTTVTVSSSEPTDFFCYYAYTDYDIVPFPNNQDAGTFTAVPAETQTFNVQSCRNQCRARFGHPLGVPPPARIADNFDQAEFPQLRDRIGAFQGCADLNGVSTLGQCPQGIDWTGALQYGTLDNPLVTDDGTLFYRRDRIGP